MVSSMFFMVLCGVIMNSLLCHLQQSFIAGKISRLILVFERKYQFFGTEYIMSVLVVHETYESHLIVDIHAG